MSSYWWEYHRFEIVGGALIAVLLALFIVASIHDERGWRAFSAAHNCKLVGHVNSSVGVGPTVTSSGNSGVTTVFIPDKEGWQCDDGVTYWRDE